MNMKATLYLDPKVFRALKVRAAKTDKTMSETVNEMLSRTLALSAGDAPVQPPVTIELRGKYGIPVIKGWSVPPDYVFRREDIYG